MAPGLGESGGAGSSVRPSVDWSYVVRLSDILKLIEWARGARVKVIAVLRDEDWLREWLKAVIAEAEGKL